MIGYLQGSIKLIDRDALIIMVNNVGYRVRTPTKLLVESRDRIGKQVKLFIHTHVKEDALDLYGFLTQPELQLFGYLLSVSGVGPKTALAVFNAGSVKAIKQAISDGDSGFFTLVSGIGKKGAQRIIVDLKGKFSGSQNLDLTAEGKSNELVAALKNMGFTRPEITQALKRIDRSKPIKEQISQALKNISGLA